MLEDEKENVGQLEILVARFYRPFKMAASSKKPPCSHEDVSSIFLNSETILFLHQIFYKGLQARMNSWPTLVLGMGARACSIVGRLTADNVICNCNHVLGSLCRRLVWRPPAHAQHLPGVCSQPPLQFADSYRVQTESALLQRFGSFGGTLCLPGTLTRDLLDLSHASG